MSACNFDACDRQATAKGLCDTHRRQQLEGKELTPIKPHGSLPPCPCGGMHYAKGMCRPCYQRTYVRKRPRTRKAPGRPERTCEIEGCGGKHKAFGMCRKHYSQANRAGRPTSAERGCQVEGCERPHYARDRCRLHGNRAQRGLPVDYVRGGGAKERPKKERALKAVPTPKPPNQASIFPAGWSKTTPKPKLKASRRGGSLSADNIRLAPNTDREIAAALRVLKRCGALDLADVLGLDVMGVAA